MTSSEVGGESGFEVANTTVRARREMKQMLDLMMYAWLDILLKVVTFFIQGGTRQTI